MRDKPSGIAGRLPVALAHPGFVRLWVGSLLSSIGTQMNNVAKVWVLYELTRSAAALGVEGLCFSIPIAVLPLFAGPVVDRLDRLLVIRVAFTVEIIESVGLASVAATTGLRPWMIYLAAAVAATRLSFAIPAGTAVTPSLVPDSALQSAMSLVAIVWSSSALVGPALAGLLLTVSPAAVVFAINALATLVALLVVRPVTISARRLSDTGRATAPRPADGVRYLLRRRHLPALQALVFLTSTLLIGTETLLPVLDVQVWHAGTVGYGLLRTAPGIAAVVAGVVFSIASPSTNPFRAIGIGVVLACGGLAAFVRAPQLGMGLTLLSLAALALIGTQILVTTCIQRDTPDRLRGAVGGITVISQSGLAGIAAAGMAVVAVAIGAPGALLATVAAVLPLALGCSVYAARRRLKDSRTDS